MAINGDFVLDLLMSMGIIGDDQAQQARDWAYENDNTVLAALESMGVLTEEEIINMVAAEYGMEIFDLSEYTIPQDVLDAVPGDIARRYQIVPLMKFDNALTIGITDPTDLETLDSLRYILKRDIEPMVVRQADLEATLKKSYASADEYVEGFMADMTSGEVDLTGVLGGEDDAAADERTEDDDAPIIKLVSLILVEAYKADASDIHLEPMAKHFRVRYRVDGVLKEVESPPKYLQNNILSRLKIMSNLDISEKRVPQDGRIAFSMPGKRIDLRVSTVPTVHGESIVMRILDQASISLGIPELGFFNDDQMLIDKILKMPDGIFLVTGPTGSGKTTSLYAFLNSINTPNRKIITAEDPVEYELSGINQVQCDNKTGMTFAKALRAMLRQAPNIVMVGEIRDIETGGIAINAALTGHMVFSTLHTNDAPGAITRLIDMGVKPFLVASAVRAVMAQRLLRRVCKNCAEPTTPLEEELELLELEPDFFESQDLVKGVGCPSCNAGYKGRLGIYEICMVDKPLLPLIFKKSSATVIKTKARELGMRTLRDDALRKAGAGMSTLAEVIRVTKLEEEEFEEE
jgi:general secretion pathway protein E/type IV pilus assembly protein PilB